MASTLSNIVIFTAGALVGSVVTYKLMKDRYEQEYDEYENEYEETDISDSSNDEHSENEEVVDIREYEKNITEMGYTNYSNSKSVEKEKDASDVDDGPYVIPPEEFDTLDDYEGVTYTYYADGVLADERDEIVEDVDDVVGLDSLETFGEYEDDSIFVRNDKLRLDFEILRDVRKYSDVVNTDPRLTEV